MGIQDRDVLGPRFGDWTLLFAVIACIAAEAWALSFLLSPLFG